MVLRPFGDVALSPLMESADELVKSESLSRRLGRGLRRAGSMLLDLAYPPVCLNCDAPTATPDTLCVKCFKDLRPITAPLCPVLGLPFEVSLGEGALSAEAIADPPPFDRARAAVLYNDVARMVVSRLKYGDRPELARFCARLMAGAGHELWDGAPILVPVPLHPARQWERRYNQSAELAVALGKITGLAVDTSLVRRSRKTRQQVGLSGDGRARNVQGAFAVHPDIPVRAKGRRVVLVDDVYTTGATTKAVTRVLKRGGVESVDVMTFARVVIGADLPI
jgi:ComF family protein